MHHVPLPILSAYKICVPALLQLLRIFHIRSQNRIACIFLVWSPNGTRSRHSCHMLIAGSAFCHQQIIIFPNMVNMRSFCIISPRARENILRLSNQTFLHRVILLHQDPFEIIDHIHHIFFPICIMKQGRIEPRTIQINWFRPASPDIL